MSWSFSRPQLIAFAVVFALIGGYILFRSFAASAPIASVEGENMIVQSTSATSSAAITASLGASTSATTSPTAKPGIPSALKATVASGSITLSWNANPTTDQVSNYQVYYGTSSTFASFTYVPSVTGTSYTVNGLTNGKTYYFRISAHNSLGYGPWTATPISAVPGAGQTTSAKPSIPSGLSATAASGSVVLKWSANPASEQVSNYQVYYSTSSAFATFSYVPSVTGTTYTVSGLTNGTTYYFRISAHNSTGYGTWSGTPVSAVPGSGQTTSAKPGIPTGLAATPANGGVTLSWTSNPAGDKVSDYQVYYGTSSTFASFTYVPTVTGTSYTVSGLTNGTSYYFRVSAHNSVGYSPWSATPISAVPGNGQTTPPSTVSQVVSDSSASNGKDMELLTNATMSGSFNLSSSATSLTVVAKATVCSSTGAAMVVSVDGSQALSTTVSTTTLTSYTTNVNLAAGSHTLTIGYTNDSTTSSCDRNLFVDVTNFYGPTVVTTPAPTVSLSATPTSVSAGSASTLTWSSTNATSCSASGAWNGNENTSGSTTTGALNQNSTYTLTCTGTGGSASKSASVTVTAASSSSSGGGGGSTGGVTAPTPPSAYTLPSNAVTVSSISALQSALSGGTTDIIITNGSYTNGSDINIGNHHIWAQSVGGVTFNFGIEMGGNASGSGPEEHGINFNVSNTGLGLNSDVISVWGNGSGAVIDDSVINGNGVMDAGILTRVTSGFTVHRVVVSNFKNYGIYFMTYAPNYTTDAPAVEPVVSDANISNVTNSPAGASNGTAEAGLWAGTDCLCSNIKVRGAGWMGIWTGANANNGVYSNFDIDQIGSDGVGVYLEHFSRGNVFKNFIIGASTAGSGVRVGFNCEWADPAYAGDNPVAGQSISACHNNTFQNGTIYSNYDGFTLEDAQNTTISNITFFNQSRSAIDDFMTAGSGQTTTWQNQGNNFAGIKSSAVQYSTAH